MREHLKKIKPDIYLLGEIWHDASQWLAGDEYDSVMNYPLMSGIHDFFLDRTMGKDEFEYMVNRCYTMYMQQNNNVLFNLLDSPCLAAISTMAKEMNSRKWFWFAILFQNVFAYVVTFMVYQIGAVITGAAGFGVGTVIAIVFLMAFLFLLFRPDPYKGQQFKTKRSVVEA